MPGTASGSRWKDPRPNEFPPPLRAAGVRALDGDHHHLSEPARAAAALDDLLPIGVTGVGAFLGECHFAAGAGFLSVELWGQLRRGGDQRNNRAPRRLGTGALPISGPQADRRLG